MTRTAIVFTVWLVAGLAPVNIAVSQTRQCSSAVDCQFPLLCNDGNCRQQCRSYRDCGAGEICVDAPRSSRDYKMCVDVDSYSQDIPPFLEGYDRPGDDIRAVPLPVYSPKLCHYVCAEETSERCFFWTIVKPGAQ
jgi:hypothetical protein